MSRNDERCGGNLALAGAGIALGGALAAAYAAWRAVAHDGGAGAFGEALLFPGALIAGVVAVMVWLGWNANIE